MGQNESIVFVAELGTVKHSAKTKLTILDEPLRDAEDFSVEEHKNQGDWRLQLMIKSG